jgi:hypothetical protein
VLTVKPGVGGAKKALERARRIVGERGDVQPVSADEKGDVTIRTGKVTVRFKTAPTEKEIEAFARPLGLTVEGRNEFVPSQVSFRAKKGMRQSVDELAERIEHDDERVQRAWPENLGVYRREK